jgi:hypothetical protein
MYGVLSASAYFASLNSRFSEEDTWLYKDRNQAVSAPEIPDTTQGLIIRAVNALTEDGLYDGRQVYVQSNPAEMSFNSLNNALFHSSVEAKVNQLTMDNVGNIYSAVQGKVKSMRANHNPDNTYNTSLETRESIQWFSDYFYSRSSAMMYGYEKMYRNFREMRHTPLVPPQGWTYAMTQSVNVDETYNATEVMRKSKPNEFYTPFNSRYGVAWLHSFKYLRGMPSYLAALDTGRNNSVTIGEQEDGTFSGQIISAPTSSGGTAWVLDAASWGHYEYKTRRDPANPRNEQGRRIYWRFYTRYDSTRATAASRVTGQFRTNVVAKQGLWFSIYSLAPLFTPWDPA